MRFSNKYILLFLLLIFAVSGNAQNSDNNLLIPYLKNDKWGLSFKDKSIKITPQYDVIAIIHPYFLAQKEEELFVLNSEGTVLSSDFYYIGEIDQEQSYLFFKLHNNTDSLSVSGKFIQYNSSFHLYKLENNHFTLLIDLPSNAVVNKTPSIGRKVLPNLYIITKNGLHGVYDVKNENVLVEPKYKHLHIPEGNYIIAYNDAEDMEIRHINGSTLPKNKAYINHDISEILDNGYFITTSEGEVPKKYANYKRDLRTPEGKTVIGNGYIEVLKNIGMIRCQVESTLKGNERLSNYYDFQGNLLLSEIREYKKSSPNLLGIFGKGYDNLIGLYNYKTRKMVWKNDFPETPKVKLVHHSDFGFSEIEVDTTFYYFDDKGNNLMKTGGYNRYYNRYKKAKTIKILPSYRDFENPYKYKYFTAIRSSEKQPFVIYDENYRKMENMQDFLGNFDSKIYAFKEYDKWKLGNFDGLVLPEQYDSITFTKTDRNFRLYKNGTSQIYLKKAKKLIPAYDYDDAIGYEHHDYYLGIKYLENLKRGQDHRFYKYLKCRVDLIDDNGNVVYSFTNNPEIGLKYTLTKTNQIIEYPDDNKYFYFRIHDTKTKEVINMKERFLRFENYKDMPVVAILASDNVRDDGKKGLWNINKQEWIIPLSTESKSYQSNEMEFHNQSDTLETIALTEITDNPEYYKSGFFSNEPQRFYTIIGYIGIDGTFYAD